MSICPGCGGTVGSEGRELRVEFRRIRDASGRRIKSLGGTWCPSCSFAATRSLGSPGAAQAVLDAIAAAVRAYDAQEEAQPTLGSGA